MLLIISGAPGSCKRKVAEFLQTKQFEIAVNPRHYPNYPDIETAIAAKVENYNRLLSKASDSDIVLIGSPWEDIDVWFQTLVRIHRLSQSEFDNIVSIFKSHRLDAPPTAVMFLHQASIANAVNRLSLSGKSDLHGEHLFHLMKRYEEWSKHVAVPLLDIEVTTRIDETLNEVDFATESIRTSKLHVSNIWSRSFYRGGDICLAGTEK